MESGVNELAENEFGDSDLAENSVVDSAVVVKLVMFAGRVEVIDGAREGLGSEHAGSRHQGEIFYHLSGRLLGDIEQSLGRSIGI